MSQWEGSCVFLFVFQKINYICVCVCIPCCLTHLQSAHTYTCTLPQNVALNGDKTHVLRKSLCSKLELWLLLQLQFIPSPSRPRSSRTENLSESSFATLKRKKRVERSIWHSPPPLSLRFSPTEECRQLQQQQLPALKDAACCAPTRHVRRDPSWNGEKKKKMLIRRIQCVNIYFSHPAGLGNCHYGSLAVMIQKIENMSPCQHLLPPHPAFPFIFFNRNTSFQAVASNFKDVWFGWQPKPVDSLLDILLLLLPLPPPTPAGCSKLFFAQFVSKYYTTCAH